MSLIGKQIPQMNLEVEGGPELDLPKDFQNKWTLLYFYPKDDTPGCTKQACGYRDNLSQFQELGVQVYGVSLDNIESHEAFRKKFSLNFPLIYDQNKELSTFLQVYGEQQGKHGTYLGLSRDSFLIGPEGDIRKEWRKVDPEKTIEDTLSTAKELKIKE